VGTPPTLFGHCKHNVPIVMLIGRYHQSVAKLIQNFREEQNIIRVHRLIFFNAATLVGRLVERHREPTVSLEEDILSAVSHAAAEI